MTLHFKPPLQHVCLLRLSAIGDTCHALAALRAFQTAWPHTRFTWIIGKLEAKLMTAILPEIEFITFDKNATLRELRRLRAALRGRRFELLLDMQLSFRASLVASLVSAPIKLGFDRARARELQWWFTNARIPPAAMRFDYVNQIGKDTLPQLLGLLSQSTVLLSPDSGPAHMASMVGLPVIGLYAATNPARAGPYYSRQWCVDKYGAAAQKYLGKPADQIPWTTKIERRGVMDLIDVNDVTAKLDALLASIGR